MPYVMNNTMIFRGIARWAGAALLLSVTTVQAGEPVTNQVKSLTLRECIERALENNLEIKTERLNPVIGQWGVVGAQGVYDPNLTGSLDYQDTKIPQNPGVGPIRQKNLEGNVGVNGRLATGATYDFFYGDNRQQGNTVTNMFTYLYTGSAGVSVTQPLLRNFGFGVNSAAIRIARENQKIAMQDFVQFVMTQMSNVSRAYYELIFAIGNHNAAVENRALARQLLEENRKRRDVGTMSPLDVIQAEAGVAESEQAVITTARAIKDNENTLKRLICQQVTEFRGLSLVPVDYPVVQMVALDVAQSTKMAMELRADYQSAKHALERQNIQVQYNRNQLWPEVDLQASYGLNGRGRDWDGFNNRVTSGDYPVWTVGISVSIPLGNRQARSNYNIARLDATQALLSLKSLEQDIIIGVDNAIGHVESNLKSVEAARAATRLAQESLDAEKKKLLAGTSTTFLVLQAQSQLASARSTEIRAFADYGESLFALDLAEGTILRKNNIILKQ